MYVCWSCYCGMLIMTVGIFLGLTNMYRSINIHVNCTLVLFCFKNFILLNNYYTLFSV